MRCSPRLFIPVFAICLCNLAQAQPRVLDACESTGGWTVVPSDGVKASLSVVDGADGKALRLSYSFEAGSGFCVIRRAIALDLPAEYRFAFQLRGDGPPNNLEFKLLDPSGENVWWINQRAYELPANWQKVTLRSRRFQFAWGPAGGNSPLAKIGAIELAIAASSGGKGSIDLDQLTFETIPPRGEARPVRVLVPSSKDAAERSTELPGDWKVQRSLDLPWPATFDLDLGGVREFGGLIIDWDEGEYPRDLDVEASLDNTVFETVARVRGARGGRRYIQIPDGEAAFLRVRILASSFSRATFTRLEIAPAEFGQSANAMFERIARDAPRGRYPRYFLREQQPWTVIGVEGSDDELLLDAAGAIELGKGGPRLEPFLDVDGKLLTWADVRIEQGLRGNCPIVTWETEKLSLTIVPIAEKAGDKTTTTVFYLLNASGAERVEGSLYLALRPFQVLPPWHELNLTGGASRGTGVTLQAGRIRCGPHSVQSLVSMNGAGASPFAAGEIVEFLARRGVPGTLEHSDSSEFASAAMRFNFSLQPGGWKPIVIRLDGSDAVAAPIDERTPEQMLAELPKQIAAAQPERGAEAALQLPPSARLIEETFSAMQHYILVNADGPRIQPGSRTYERSWIRDGALTGTALLVTGHGDKLRDFLDWYATFQYPSGKIPCVVDRRGPDPVPENDSHGEYIYGVATYYRFTNDQDFLHRHFPRVEKAVAYIESLRAQRMTEEFRSGPAEKRMLYGLVPESISHEGYSAKPMHSYWDGFFTIRGLSDAAYLAGAASQPQLASRWQTLADDYRDCMYGSMRMTIDLHKIDYIPGCAELGDFDATSTAIGVFPCGEHGRIPEPALTNTFQRYLKYFRDRRDGRIAWREFTPYEVRLIGALVHMDRPDEAHELLDWFFQYQRPAGWRQWGEVAYRDEHFPGFVGDMPHTWVGGDFLNSVRSMFVYERGDTLVLAAGVPKRWLEENGSLSVKRFPTPFGPLSYSMLWVPTGLRLHFPESNAARPAAFELRIPGARPIESIEVDNQDARAEGRVLKLAPTARSVRIDWR